MPLNICVIGCGWMARAGHGPAYRRYFAEYPDTALLACCDIDAERAEGFRADFGFAKAYTDWREMLRAEKPDAVCLLVNVERICAMSCEIFEMGFPLLLEKPPGLDVAETTRMAEAAAKYGVPHAVAFNRRSAPVIIALRDEVAALDTPVQRIHYEQLRKGRRDPDFSTTAIHGIDALRHIAGTDYKHIAFAYQELPELGPGVCNIAAECVLTSGASASLLFAPVTGKVSEGARVLTLNHCLEMSFPVTDKSDFYITNGFYGENRDFFEDIRAGNAPEHTLATAIQSVAVAECIRNRAKEFIRT
jgi:predicted dehydrogenase